LRTLGFSRLVAFGLLYVGAKIHFFTRFGVMGPGRYIEEHWFFWIGLAVPGGSAASVDWFEKRRKGSKLS
jgi:hypothetical protein